MWLELYFTLQHKSSKKWMKWQYKWEYLYIVFHRGKAANILDCPIFFILNKCISQKEFQAKEICQNIFRDMIVIFYSFSLISFIQIFQSIREFNLAKANLFEVK